MQQLILMRLVLLAVLSVAALSSAGPAFLPTDVESRRFDIVTPPNEQLYQSFSLSLPAYSVRVITFRFPEDRSITYYDFQIVSGTGNFARFAGGIGSNYLTVRVDTAARALNYRVVVQTREETVGGGDDSSTTSTSTPISPDEEEGEEEGEVGQPGF